jgi:hypothetical protein
VTGAALALRAAEARLVERLDALAKGIDAGEDVWQQYAAMAAALAQVTAQLAREDHGRAMTSTELGERFRLSAKTAARKAKAGQLPVTPIRLGERGRAAVRWRASV